MSMEKLKCIIERIIYHSETNGFSVLRVAANGFPDIVTAVGAMPEVRVGAMFELYGEWRINPKYGQEFVFQTCEEVMPATVSGIKKYLGSGLIKGIGPVYAARIVDVFGENTIKILDNDPDRLCEVHGIGKKRLEQIKQSWLEQREVRNIMIFLQSHNVSTSLATKIYKQYGARSVQSVTENPYRLADEIWGVGFKTADQIAKELGFGHERIERLRSGILYTLNKFSESGNCFAYKDALVKAAGELLEVEESLLETPLQKMLAAKEIIREELPGESDAIYLPLYYYSEVGTAKRLLELINSPSCLRIRHEFDTPDLDAIHYDEAQLEAIKAALKNKVMVLTGGPGTGKTTTTLGIIQAYRDAGAKILLAAPTGRAAKRMSEVCKMEAKTIHRLLEMRPPEGFQRNEDNPLNGDVLIVDECSMIDIILMNALLRAVPDNMTVILVGDVDQLPSVGAGKVLADILASGAIPFVKLSKIFRQAQKSMIITNAHKINHGDMPFLTDRASDFIFLPEEGGETSDENSARAADRIVNLCVDVLPRQGIISDEIQVLTPMRRGETGSANLNLRLQAALNPEGASLKRAGIDYRVNDRVMQIRNNYDKGIFNGDIGFIESVNLEDNELVVNFDDRPVKYDMTDLDELVLAYATTIHKSQGSEFPYVIMPLTRSHYMMLQRNLLYTGVTRAKEGLILIGEKKAVYIAVKNDKITERNTRLAQRLFLGKSS